nr:alkyl hydroperoxide reductase [Elizabethkingia sp. ASV34]
MRIKLKFFIFFIYAFQAKAQMINMYFPYFSGKTYNFIIFQGDKQITLSQGTIPLDGIFSLSIPKEFAPYKGMARWLITGTKEGGGLDMYIPGKSFSISCTSVNPNNNNIIYLGNMDNQLLNDLCKEQADILLRYEVMLQATRIFNKENEHYHFFTQELHEQQVQYNSFHKNLKGYPNYISQFIQIVNVTKGKGSKLLEKEETLARNINSFITEELKWDFLYTSGYWASLINNWVNIHTHVFKDIYMFENDFKKILAKDKMSPQLAKNFLEAVVHYLSQQKEADYLKVITPLL